MNINVAVGWVITGVTQEPDGSLTVYLKSKIGDKEIAGSGKISANHQVWIKEDSMVDVTPPHGLIDLVVSPATTAPPPSLALPSNQEAFPRVQLVAGGNGF